MHSPVSLVRKVFDPDRRGTAPCAELGGASIGETLLTPTKIYVRPVLKVLERVCVKSVSHITGGGFYENLPRSLPEGLSAKIEKKAIASPRIFDLIAKTGNISERDMFNTFNMGVGMTLVVDAAQADSALGILRSAGEEAYILGEVVESDQGLFSVERYRR